MMKRNLPHLVVSNQVKSDNFSPIKRGSTSVAIDFPYDRKEHGRRLHREYKKAFEISDDNAKEDNSNRRKGTHITFASFPELELALQSLEIFTKGDVPRLLAVKRTKDGTQQATVWIPQDKKNVFLDKLNKYIESVNSFSKDDKEKAENHKLIESIKSIFRSTLLELWTDDEDMFPSESGKSYWWEVWLREDRKKSIEELITSAKKNNARVADQYLGIGDRFVILLYASIEQLSRIFYNIDDIAELRGPSKVSALPLANFSRLEQADWVEELQKRMKVAKADAPAVCILDQGINSHPLLIGSLDNTDKHVADPIWKHDPVKYAHGTEMAGLALFGDLNNAVLSNQEIILEHRLESVKVLPDGEQNKPELYGIITAQGVDQPEINAINKRRIFMMAITARDSANIESAGRPTSWSTTIDALAFGRAIKTTNDTFIHFDRDDAPLSRLFILSAGNILDLAPNEDYRTRNDAEPIEDPAQSWNAITVGAYSSTDDMQEADPSFDGWVPIASRGDISPSSRTSVAFDFNKWPCKPEVVADGGNYAISPDKVDIDSPENLAILTTRYQPQSDLSSGFFSTTRDTSAATAQVAGIAADIWASYPDLRPETVRALIVHSAEWTSAMQSQFDSAKRKEDLIRLLRRYGMGVPSLDRARYSAENATTLISESIIHPFGPRTTKGILPLREINIHQLPWPIEELDKLGETEMRMRVTLSYFIEPNPSSRGWEERYKYSSHGLRFGVKRPEDNIDTFLQRWNQASREGNMKPPKLDTEKGWLFGTKFHNSPGSLHTDIWTGTAANLAAKGAIVVYPVSGWWKYHPRLDQSDMGVNYSLIVSIEAPEVDVELWTPIKQKIETTTEISI